MRKKMTGEQRLFREIKMLRKWQKGTQSMKRAFRVAEAFSIYLGVEKPKHFYR